jgi:hypothetical protein
MAGVGTPRRLSYGALAAGIGGIVLIISLFLDWASSGGFGANAWQSFKITDIVLLVLGLLAIGYAAIELTGAAVNLPFRRERALTVIGIIATTLTLDFLIEGSNQAIGLILAFLASAAILVGGLLAEHRPELAMTLGGGAGAPTQQMPPAGGGYGAPPVQQQQPQQPQPQQYAAPPPVQQAPPPAAGPQATTVGQVQPPPQPAAPPPPAGGAADWYPDPTGQKRLRYWDGSQWTDHTAD